MGVIAEVFSLGEMVQMRRMVVELSKSDGGNAVAMVDGEFILHILSTSLAIYDWIFEHSWHFSRI